MEVNVHRDQHPLFTLVHHHHTEKQTRVHLQFIQQHIQFLQLLQRFCKTL